MLADEDIEEDPDRWCSYTECGQELWQIACQWVWNLRLSLGKMMQGGALREMEWAPPTETAPLFFAWEDPPEEYGPWECGFRVGTSGWSFHCRGLYLARGWQAPLPGRGQPPLRAKSVKRTRLRERAVYLAYQTDCLPCALREQCLDPGAKGNRVRRVSAVRRLLPTPASVERKPVKLGPLRWVDVAGRALRRTWTAHWRGQYVEVLALAEASKNGLPPPRPPRAVRQTSSLELA